MSEKEKMDPALRAIYGDSVEEEFVPAPVPEEDEGDECPQCGSREPGHNRYYNCGHGVGCSCRECR
jgi:hypothetical protein